MKISVLTPSIRPGGLDMVERCLKRQDEQDFEWLVSTPYKAPERARQVGVSPKGDYFYALNRDWNKLYQEAKGELIVNIVDLLWFPPDTLTRFWNHYLANPKALVTSIGHQYQKEEGGRYENLIWQDPRARTDLGSFYEVAPSEMEMCLCSVPRQAILDCGGLDEDYDKGAAISEKEMCWRLDKLGYKFFIDQTIEYQALHHERLNSNEKWDKAYKVASQMFVTHMDELHQDRRKLNVGYVKNA